MTDVVRIRGQAVIGANWGRLTNYELSLLRRDGRWQDMEREVYDHGSAAAILLCNRARKTVILIRQFRFPVHLNGDNPLLIEVCAGLLDDNAPEDAARREAEEESGFRVGALTHAFDTYMSPGSLTEKVACFIAEYDDSQRIGAGGGLEAEGEDIEVLEMAFDEAFAMIGRGEIIDGKTVMLLQHAKLAGIFG